jgi:hypothetical protein
MSLFEEVTLAGDLLSLPHLWPHQVMQFHAATAAGITGPLPFPLNLLLDACM